MTVIAINLTASPTFTRRLCQAFISNRLALVCACLLLLFLALALIVPYVSPYTYFEIDLQAKNQPPSLKHWFGTDDLGRDLFTRIWFGARISLFVGIAAASIDLVTGTLWGGAAALVGGKLEECMMRLADVLATIPTLLVIIALMVVMGPGLPTIIAALSLLGWIGMARVVRQQFLQVKQQSYVLAAKALGAGFWRILLRHLLPNSLGPILVTLTLTIPSAIFTEAFLSYLGLGVQAPIASWGVMASEGLPALAYYPWRLFFPAGMICATLCAFNGLGEGLNDAFNRAMRT
jgi:oligopeptide transport system permease protein